jgi:hypothetical protein
MSHPEIAALMKGPGDPDLITDAERSEFSRHLLSFHHSRGVSVSFPNFGDKQFDSLAMIRTVKDLYGNWNSVDSEDLMAIAKFLKIKLNAIPNGLATLRACYETYLLPLELYISSPQSLPPPKPTPLSALTSQSPAVPSVVFAGELKPSPPVPPVLVPAVIPHSLLDLGRIALGVEQKSALALKALDGYLTVISEGRIIESKLDSAQFLRVASAVGYLVSELEIKTDSVLTSHALFSWTLCLQRGGFTVMREAMVKCMEISSSSNWSLRSRILAIRAVLFCKDEPCHSFALSILRYATEPELGPRTLSIAEIRFEKNFGFEG